jgi:hypothetical protein
VRVNGIVERILLKPGQRVEKVTCNWGVAQCTGFSLPATGFAATSARPAEWRGLASILELYCIKFFK